MLGYYLNNKPLAMDIGTRVKLSFRNRACNFESFPGDIGTGIDIPVNEVNRAVLGNPERFERIAANNRREYENFEIRYGGVPLMKGTLVLQNANHKSYSGWLRSDVGNIGKEFREKNIGDSVSFNEEKVFENKNSYSPETDDYACPRIYNPDFFKEKGEKTPIIRYEQNPNYNQLVGKWHYWGYWSELDTNQYIEKTVEVEDLTEAFMVNGGWMVNARNPDGSVKYEPSWSKAAAEEIVENLKVNVVSPMLYLSYVVKTLLKDAGFGVSENFLEDDPDLKNLVLYSNFDITTIEHFATEETYILEFEDENMGIEYGPVSSTVVVDNVRRHLDGPFFYKDLLPKMPLKNFVLGLQNMFNVVFHFVPGRKIVKIIDRESIFEKTPIDIQKYLTGHWEMGENKDNTLKFAFEHDDDDMQIMERWVDLSDYRDKEREPVDTWEDLNNIEDPKIDEVRKIKSKNIYVQYGLHIKEWDDEETGEHHKEKYIGWKLLSIGFQNAFYNYGQEEQEDISTDFSTLDGIVLSNTRQKGNARSELFAYETFTPRLIFNDSTTHNGRFETDNISLDWEKEQKGLLESRWPNIARIWSTRQAVKTEGRFPLGMLMYIINNIYKVFWCDNGEFIIEEITAEFGINDIGVTEISGYKFNYSPKTYSLDEMWKMSDIIWIDQTIEAGDINKWKPLILK